MQQPQAPQVKRVLFVQSLMTVTLAAAGLWIDVAAALSVLIGAGACTLANALFALLVFRRYRAQEASLLVMGIYGAEILKIALILALFAAAFAFIEGLNLPALLGSYFIVQVMPALVASEPDAARTNEK